MVTRLPDLPEELISNITCKLGDDKFALRATCRALEEKSFHEFATEHFSEKCVHFTTDSLKVLRDISSCPRLSKFVKEASIVTALFSEQGFCCPGRSTPHWKPSVRQSEAYKFYVNDQNILSATGEDKRMLTEAFKNLSCLKTVALIDNTDCLKAGTDYRGGNKVLRQTGISSHVSFYIPAFQSRCQTLDARIHIHISDFQSLGTHPISGMDSIQRLRSPEFQKHLEHLWSTLISALADAHGHLSLDELRTNFSSDLTFINPLKQFSLNASQISRLSKVFENTTKLRLHIRSPERKDMLAKFTRTFSNLKELSLDFDLKQGSGPLYQKFALGVDMSRLTSLNLLGLSVDAARLTSSITRLRDVTDLRFYCVNLATGAWPVVLKSIANLAHLEHLHLMYLREAGHKSYFLKQRDPPDNALDNWGLGEHWSAPGDFNGDEDDDDDESSLDDDSMPDLQPADDSWVDPAPEPQPGGPVSENPDQSTYEGTGGNSDNDDAVSEYVPRDFPQGYTGERGFYICIEGHSKIAKRLPTFIDEYNTGEFMDEDDDIFPPGMGPFPMGGGQGMATVAMNAALNVNMPAPPPGFDAFINAVGNHFGAAPMNPAPNHNNNPPGVPFTFPVPFGPPPPPAPTTAAPAAATTTTSVPAAAPTAPSFATTNASPGWDLSDQEDWEDEEDDAFGGGGMD